MHVETAAIERLVYIRLDPDEDLLQGLQQAVSRLQLRNGAILAGVGSLKSYRFHVVSTPVLPPENAFMEGKGPYDIVTVTGAILDGRVHAHVTFTDTQVAMGGHLEEGCQLLTFAIIVIADTSAAPMTKWDHVGPLSGIR